MTAQPTINSITDIGDQASAIANVSGSGTVQLYYRKRGAAAWTTGLTRDCRDPNLVTHYKMNDSEASAVIVDSMDFSNATLLADNDTETGEPLPYNTNLASIVDGVGRAIRLDNSAQTENNFINTNNTFQTLLRSSFAINFAFRWHSLNAVQPHFLFGVENDYGEEPGDPQAAIQLKVEASGQFTYWYSSQHAKDIIRSFSVTPSLLLNWNYITITHEYINGTSFKLNIYFNGVKVITDAMGTADMGMYTAYNMKMYLGWSSGSPSEQYFDGDIDNFMFFNKALSAAEVLALYNSGDGIEDIESTGDITQTGLEPGWYEFYATDTVDGATSAPSNLITMQIADVPVVETSVNEFDQSAINASPEMITIMGEPVTFFPDGGGSRSILAIIDRGGQAALPSMRGNAPMTTITVMNNSTTGISSAEINVDCDKVSLALRRGKLPQQRIITKILYEDAGMLQMEVR